MSQSMRVRLLGGGAGALVGCGLGFVFFFVTQPPRGPVPLFLPVVFAGVFAIVVFIAAEQLFPILLEIVIGFLILGGGTYLWHYFVR
jgi:hypothetical protein